MLPSDIASSEVEVLKTKLLSALDDIPIVSSSSCTPEFCVRMARRQEETDNPITNVVAQLKFCEHQLKMSREACDVEAYSVLVATATRHPIGTL
ncbi:hypothetical protein GQ600_14613 [Phytophthora cactorum]|nr:hypothetical protein GQ600_14613 [Phytophthora cactorum]